MSASTGGRDFFRRLGQYIPHVLNFQKRLSESDSASRGQLDRALMVTAGLSWPAIGPARLRPLCWPLARRDGDPVAAAGCANGGPGAAAAPAIEAKSTLSVAADSLDSF